MILSTVPYREVIALSLHFVNVHFFHLPAMFVRNNRNVSTKISRNSALSKEQVTNVVKKKSQYFLTDLK